jgi:hypothetical protein
MPLRPCLSCGKPCTTTRCAPCARTHEAARGTTAQRGLSGDHARMSRHYKDTNAACVHCQQTGTPTNPITAGHIIARSRGGTNDPSNYQPECRTCNSRKGTR